MENKLNEAELAKKRRLANITYNKAVKAQIEHDAKRENDKFWLKVIAVFVLLFIAYAIKHH